MMRPRVTLVGAGPGDPELMTLKAARAEGIEVEVIPGITAGAAVPAARAV